MYDHRVEQGEMSQGAEIMDISIWISAKQKQETLSAVCYDWIFISDITSSVTNLLKGRLNIIEFYSCKEKEMKWISYILLREHGLVLFATVWWDYT